MRNFIWLIIGLMFFSPMQSLIAATKLGPPIEDLLSHPERNQIVIAEAIEKSESPRIRFAVREQLSGDSPAELLLRTNEETFADVEVGRSYIVAWTELRRNRRIVAGWEKHSEGPYVLSLLGMGTDAVFENTPELRFLFADGTMEQSGNSGQQIDALLTQMQREDFRSRSLMISELYLRSDLTEQMQQSHAGTLKAILQNEPLDAQQRDFIIRSVRRLPQNLTSPWLAEELRKIIILHGTQYDLRSFVPGLVRTAARGLSESGEPADIDLLSLLLYANNPGVSKAALTTMIRLDSVATVEKAQQAIERGWIHSETRMALTGFLGQAKTQSTARPVESR